MPRVSVLTPTYNHSAFIKQCIDSVRSQTFPDWEMIVVDDGSTDDTVELIEATKEPRIKVIRQSNMGIGALGETYNAALANATGEFIAILEGDDYWPADKLATQVPLFEEGVVLVSGRKEVVHQDGKPIELVQQIPLTSELSNDPPGHGALGLMDQRYLTFTYPVATLIRRSALENVGGFHQPNYLPIVDLPTFVAVSEQGKFRWADKVCGYWRRHASSVTKSSLPLILDGVYKFIGEWLERDVPHFEISDERLTEFKDRWSAFMVHRAVLLSHELWAEGDKDGARKAAELACSFNGPLKRRMKAKFARSMSQLKVSDKTFRTLTMLKDSQNIIPPFDRLVDKGMIERVKPWRDHVL